MDQANAIHAVIADDLTGASDTGVQFARSHLRTRALLGHWSKQSVTGADVIVINTESRALNSKGAYDKVKEACEQLRDVQAYPVYKKIDSTMRGPVGAEIDAVIGVFGHRMAIVCPAFPDTGRIVIGGHLLVDGQPVHRTPIGRDPVAPVHESYLPKLLAEQSQLPVHHVALDTVARGAQHLGKQLAQLPGDDGSIVVIDATADTDLEVIVQAVEYTGHDALLVGSAGLARPLAMQLAAVREEDAPDERSSPLIVVGSVNPVSRRQLKHLKAKLQPEYVELDVARLLQDESSWEEHVQTAVQQVQQAASSGRSVLLTTPGETEDVEKAQQAGAEQGLTPPTIARRIASALGAAAARVIHNTKLAGVVVTGGDTAQALLDQMQASGIDLVSEVLPGIPYGRIHGGSAPGLPIITKAGGFGGPDALVQATGYFVGQSEP